MPASDVHLSDGESLHAEFRAGLELHRVGRFQEALATYERLLTRQPDHPPFLSSRGAALGALKRYEEALTTFERALAVQPGFVPALSGKVTTLRALGRPADALAACEQGLAIQPDDAGLLSQRGALLAGLGRLQDAVWTYERALKTRPDDPKLLIHLGSVLGMLKRLPEALAACDRALTLQPANVPALVGRVAALRGLARHEEALDACDRLLAIQPRFVAGILTRVACLRALGRHSEALEACDRALEIDPKSFDGLGARGVELAELGRHDEALASFDRALAVRSDSAGLFYNRGNVLRTLGRSAEAVENYDRALALHPDDLPTLCNRGNALRVLDRHVEAIESFERALAVDPDFAEAHWNEGLAQLALGNLAEGWQNYEWRWKAKAVRERRFPGQRWQGSEALEGRSLLIQAEQGLGDTLHFARYARLLRERGARVLLEVQPLLKRVAAGFDGVEQVVAVGERLPAHDFYCPMLSLPLAFGTTLEKLPDQVPYLRAPEERLTHWAGRLGERHGPRVGIVWAGAKSKWAELRQRSLPLRSLLPLLSLPGLEFVSLQKEVPEEDRAVLAERSDLLHVGDEIGDFTDTAALVSLMDLVVSVDTATAHLAGALARPLWILLGRPCDWRWMLEREDSPWYPTARLFRQVRGGEWDDPVRRVVDELRAGLPG
jgi:tetratricopeptide (TPR) repeat protein